MNDDLYSELATDAGALISEFGQPCSLGREGTGGGVYDPETGTTTDVVDLAFPSNAVKLDYETRDIDGTNILAGDVRFLISFDLGTQPTSGDIITLTRDGSQWNVVRSKPIDPGGVVVIYDVQARAA